MVEIGNDKWEGGMILVCVIVVVNCKGGIVKIIIVVNLVYEIVCCNKCVLVIDCDN